MSTKYTITVEEMATNVAQVMQQAAQCVHCEKSEAGRWYSVKGAWIREQANRYGLSLDHAFPIYALLSANATVPETDRQFVRYLRRQKVLHFPVIKDRIRGVRLGHEAAFEFKNAAKLTSFAENLRYPRRRGVVTVDRWSARIAVKDSVAAKAILARAKLRGYNEIAAAYQMVADWLDMTDNSVQALTWVHVQESHDAQ